MYVLAWPAKFRLPGSLNEMRGAIQLPARRLSHPSRQLLPPISRKVALARDANASHVTWCLPPELLLERSFYSILKSNATKALLGASARGPLAPHFSFRLFC